MPAYVERFKRCPDCNVRASVRRLWWVHVEKEDFKNDVYVSDYLEVCSNCIKNMLDGGYDVEVDFDDDDDY